MMTDQQRKLFMAHVRHTFLKDDISRWTLRKLLDELHWMDRIDQPEHTVLHNFAVQLIVAGEFTVPEIMEGAELYGKQGTDNRTEGGGYSDFG